MLAVEKKARVFPWSEPDREGQSRTGLSKAVLLDVEGVHQGQNCY